MKKMERTMITRKSLIARVRNTVVKAVVSASVVMILMTGVSVTSDTNMFVNTTFTIEAEAAQQGVTYYPKYTGKSNSIVDALKSLGIDSSFSHRKQIAALNGMSSYSGTAAENTKMLSLLKKGLLVKSKGTSSSSKVSNGGQAVYKVANSYKGKSYGSFESLGFHWRAWCADYVSYCAKKAGQSKAIPWNASVSGLRTAIKNAGGKEYSKATVSSGKYTPVRGDIIIFKSNGASHVGIVDCQKGNTIYYIDGNNTRNGNGYKSSVQYSSCKVSDSRFTCILKPAYR